VCVGGGGGLSLTWAGSGDLRTGRPCGVVHCRSAAVQTV